MPELRVVELRICGGSGGFGLEVHGFLGLGWALRLGAASPRNGVG